MRMFTYYITHTFVNQIKKLFKTWILVFFLISGLIGGLIGAGAATLSEAAPEKPAEEQQEEEIPLDQRLGLEKTEILELAAGAVILATLVFCAVGADKNGSKIFQPADVNLLFASPMKPQSVLMFRLTTQMGAGLMGSIILLMQIPSFMSMGFSGWGVLCLMLTWDLALVLGSLLKVLLYTACSSHPRMKKYLRTAIFAFLGVLGLCWFVYWKTTDLTALQGAAAFFNHPAARYIPFWGWLKAFCMYGVEGNAAGCLGNLAALILGSIALGVVIWHIKADFYEDAMAQSQETAAIMEQAASDKVIRKRKKDRSDSLRRDEMGHGWGANVFFWKAMYNRFRFAHFRVFTKTSETYLAAALAVAAICRFVAEIPGLMPVGLTLGVMAFYRALVNPLDQDTKLDSFRMIPERTWKKMFWSLAGGTANCVLDLIPAMAAATLLLGENPLYALMWIPFIASVDFFSTTVGSFIQLSVPMEAGRIIKQMTQVMFIYFGLLPDIGIMAVGIVFDSWIPAALICVAVNLALGFLFLALLPLFIVPGEGKDGLEEQAFTGSLKTARRQFSTLTLGAVAILVIGTAAQNVASLLFPKMLEDPWGMWVVGFAPLYLIGVPLGVLLMSTAPREPLPRKKMTIGSWGKTLLICLFLMLAGNMFGMLILALLEKISGAAAVNPLEMLAFDQLLLPRILVMVIIGPAVEEYIFRRQLIDRMHVYGGRTAVVMSALMFGLFHGNLSQFFYAFLLGLVFGYVYYRTGKLRYTMAMHMVINLGGGIIAPTVAQHLLEHDLTELSVWTVAGSLMNLLILAGALVGLVLLCLSWRKIRFPRERLQLPRGKAFCISCGNVGMILLIAGFIASTVMTFLM